MSQLTGAAPQRPLADIAVTSVAEVQDAVRECASRGQPLRIAGAGSWLAAGRPVDAPATLSLRQLCGVVEYVPGDLTLTAWAGTTLEELDHAVAEYGQWMALDPFGARQGTLGATMATASNGPLAASFGTARDVVLGMQCVSGDGEVVQGGARVVKHVAGFDLVRLMTGAWGTLGIITQLTVRLRARAPVDATYVVALDATPLPEWFADYRAASVAPLAAELLSAATAYSLGIGQGVVALVRVAGNDEAVAAQEAALRNLGDVQQSAPDVWTRFAASDPAAPSAALRLSRRTAHIAEAWDEAIALARDVPAARVHATLDRGVARVVLPDVAEETLRERIRNLTSRSRGGRVFEVLPPGCWPVPAPGAVADALNARIRAAFDPQRILNRGILGEA